MHRQDPERDLPAAQLRSGRARSTNWRDGAASPSHDTDKSSHEDTAILGSFHARTPPPSLMLRRFPLDVNLADSPAGSQPAAPSHPAPSQTNRKTETSNYGPSYFPPGLETILENRTPASQAYPQSPPRGTPRVNRSSKSQRRRRNGRFKKSKDLQTQTDSPTNAASEVPQGEARFPRRVESLTSASASRRPIETAAEQAYPSEETLREFMFPRNMNRPAPRIPPGLPFPAHLSNPVVEQSAHALEENRYRFRPGRECLHESVVRRWTYSFDMEVCDACGERKRFLYTCTCDTPDWSPYSPSFDPEHDDVQARSTVILSKSVQRWIARGAYTHEKIEKLLDQKIDCLTKAWNQRNGQSPEPSVLRPRPPDPTDSLSLGVWALWAWEHDQELQTGERMRRPCRRRACESCWRAADSAWGSIDAVVSEPYVDPPRIAEYINRPISNLKLVRNLPSDPGQRLAKGIIKKWIGVTVRDARRQREEMM